VLHEPKKYALVLEFESRYNEWASEDIACLVQKLIDYGKLIQQENNGGVKHMGLHFNLVKVDASHLR
jgi:hypothetical protein